MSAPVNNATQASLAITRAKAQLKLNEETEKGRQKLLLDQVKAFSDARAKGKQAEAERLFAEIKGQAAAKDAEQKAKEQAAAKQGPSPVEQLPSTRVDTSDPTGNISQAPDLSLTAGGPQGAANQPAATEVGPAQAAGGGTEPGGSPVPPAAAVPAAPDSITTVQETTRQAQPNVFAAGRPTSFGPLTTRQTTTRPNVLTQAQRLEALEQQRRTNIDTNLAERTFKLNELKNKSGLANDQINRTIAREELKAAEDKGVSTKLTTMAVGIVGLRHGAGTQAEADAVAEARQALPEDQKAELALRIAAVEDARRIGLGEAGEGLGTGIPGITKPVEAELQRTILGQADLLGRIDGIERNLQAPFLTFEGNLLYDALRRKGRSVVLGRVFGGMSTEDSGNIPDGLNFQVPDGQGGARFATEAEWFDRFTQFSTATLTNLNLYIKQITGAQMSAQEAERLIKPMPNPKDSARQFKAKMKQLRRDSLLSLVRARLFSKGGFGDETIKAAIQAASKLDPNKKVTVEILDAFGEKTKVVSNEWVEQGLSSVGVNQMPDIMKKMHRRAVILRQRTDPNTADALHEQKAWEMVDEALFGTGFDGTTQNLIADWEASR